MSCPIDLLTSTTTPSTPPYHTHSAYTHTHTPRASHYTVVTAPRPEGGKEGEDGGEVVGDGWKGVSQFGAGHHTQVQFGKESFARGVHAEISLPWDVGKMPQVTRGSVASNLWVR